jgi:Sulfotransferase family
MASAGPDIADIDFDDLASPRLTDVQRQVLQFTEGKRVEFDLDQMLAEAIDQAGFKGGANDLDDTDGFGERLSAHVAAIEADDGLTQLTRSSLRQRVVRLLRNRLSLTDLIKRYPEIELIPIDQPFIVVGMPRSGTTHLVNLIAADPRRRALPYWESQDPIPALGQGPDIFGVDPRYARAKSEHDALMVSAPVVAAMHDRFPEAIEEEVELLDLDFAGYVLEWHARVPDWRDYYLGLDQYRHYAYLKKVLQALTFLRGPRSWVLKSPQHCEQLGPLMATFPDATVAFTHRDPVAVIQSAITMMAYSDRLRRTSVDLSWLLDYWSDRVHRLLSACVRDRGLVPAEHSIDISFHHLNGNEITLLEQLYQRADVELTTKARSRFQQYLDGNPRGKHGRINYDLQRHFGIAPEELRERFTFYFNRFDVLSEASFTR